MDKRDELMPPRPGRRSWTRAEDYLPKRRSRRSAARGLQARPAHPENETHGQGRPLLGMVPFLGLMLGLAILVIAVMIAAWPGRKMTTGPSIRAQPAAPLPAQAPANGTGTAAPGWLGAR